MNKYFISIYPLNWAFTFVLSLFCFGTSYGNVSISKINVLNADSALTDAQFIVLKKKVVKLKASVDEAYLYMKAAEGRESWEIKKVLQPYIKNFPDPSASKKLFFIHLRLLSGTDSTGIKSLRLARIKLMPEMTREEKFESALFMLKSATQLAIFSMQMILDTSLFISHFEYYLPEYRHAGKFVLLLHMENKKALFEEMENKQVANVLFGKDAQPILCYLFASSMADRGKLNKEEWEIFLSKIPTNNDDGKDLDYLFSETINLVKIQISRF